MNPWFHLLCKPGEGSDLGCEASHILGKGSVKAEQVLFLPELTAQDLSASKGSYLRSQRRKRNVLALASNFAEEH